MKKYDGRALNVEEQFVFIEDIALFVENDDSDFFGNETEFDDNRIIG